MIKLSKYIKELSFDYAISYSGLRGIAFENLEFENKTRIKEIEEEMKTARFMEKSKLAEKTNSLLDEIDISNSRIVTINGKLHKSTRQIQKFDKESLEMKEILKILRSKFKQQVYAICTPIFRDAIVFYSKENEIVGVLHICFGCLWMKNENEEDIEIDTRLFFRLKNQFIKMGHQIKDGEF